jgi:peptidyl-dipeptidase Dcp
MSHLNPFFQPLNTPFETFPLNNIGIQDYQEAFEKGIEKENLEIERIINQEETPSFINTILALENSGNLLDTVSTIFFNILEAESCPEMDELAEKISPILSEHNSEILHNEKLFNKIQYVWDHRNNIKGEDFQLLKKTYENFIRNGAHLKAEKKEEYKQIVSELSKLTIEFSQNLLAETNAYTLQIEKEEDLAGLPQSQIEQASQCAQKKGLKGWVFTLKAPSYIPFITHAQNRDLREKIYKAYAFRCSKENNSNNYGIVTRITDLRRQLANLLGYKNYAEYALTKRMAANTSHVYKLLNELINAYIDKAHEEVDKIKKYAQEKEGNDFELQAWDFNFYANKLKQERFNFDDEDLRPYFKLNNVIKGVFKLANTLYGITFKENKEIPTYHEDVKTFEIYDKDGSFLAILYMDLFSREGKQGGAWMTNFKEQYIDKNGNNHRPHVSITTNFTRETENVPPLLTFNELETLLHEFGHALHGIFSNTHYKSLSGTHVLWDFVELPSQLMENYATEKDFLKTFAYHYQTGECIPDDLIEKITESRNYNVAYACIKQVSYALIDMAYYTSISPICDLEQLEQEATKQVKLLPQIPKYCMGLQFSHIMSGGYAAGYYSYKWAEVLDADAFESFKEYGIFNPEIAQKFRNEILSQGGTKDPMDLYVAFKKRTPNIQALLKRNGISHG